MQCEEREEERELSTSESVNVFPCSWVSPRYTEDCQGGIIIIIIIIIYYHCIILINN